MMKDRVVAKRVAHAEVERECAIRFVRSGRERAEMRARTAVAQAQDAGHAARVERDQEIVSRETVSDYQKDIDRLRRRSTERMRAAAAGADPGGGGDTDMPGLPKPAGGADGAAGENRLPAEDALIASEIALRLRALQSWARAQEEVDR